MEKKEKVVRLALTDKCNLTCKYCCMQDPNIRSTFKETNKFPDVSQATSVAITGGEPLILEQHKITKTLLNIRKQTKAPIYLYTNGIYLNHHRCRMMSPFVAGINVGWHEHNEELFEYLFKAIDVIIPVRLMIQNTNIEAIARAHKEEVDYKIWTLGDCASAENEERWLMI